MVYTPSLMPSVMGLLVHHSDVKWCGSDEGLWQAEDSRRGQELTIPEKEEGKDVGESGAGGLLRDRAARG